MMDKSVRLYYWRAEKDKVKLVYEDNTIVYVSKTDFDRAFGCIISASKDEVIRDFAIDNE